eukprot:Pgem_evm1s14907
MNNVTNTNTNATDFSMHTNNKNQRDGHNHDCGKDVAGQKLDAFDNEVIKYAVLVSA